MLMYWLLLTMPALAVLTPYRLNVSKKNLAWWLCAVWFVIVIGLRDRVGGDWVHYQDSYNYIARSSFMDALKYGDPGYFGLEWLVSHWGGNIYVVNTFCAAIVMAGVVVFARAQPLPWLALFVAVPYLIVVVAMGYTRQSAALGLALIGMAALGHSRILKFVIWVLLGALFHKSAVLLLPIAALATTKHRVWSWFWVATTSIAAAILLVLDDTDTLRRNYIDVDQGSQGGLIRVLMDAVPAVLFLAQGHRFRLTAEARKLWLWMSMFSLACIPLVMISSTATDRVALYFLPIQMYVFAHLPRLATTIRVRTFIVLGVVVYYIAVMYVWLNYAQSAKWWVPYHFMPL